MCVFLVFFINYLLWPTLLVEHVSDFLLDNFQRSSLLHEIAITLHFCIKLIWSFLKFVLCKYSSFWEMLWDIASFHIFLTWELLSVNHLMYSVFKVDYNYLKKCITISSEKNMASDRENDRIFLIEHVCRCLYKVWEVYVHVCRFATLTYPYVHPAVVRLLNWNNE